MLLVQTDANRFVSSESFRDRFMAILCDREKFFGGSWLEGNVSGIFPEEMLCGFAAPRDKIASSQMQSINVYQCNN